MTIKKITHPLSYIILLLVFTNCTNTNNQKNEVPELSNIVIPFELTDYNNIKIKTVLNGKDSLDLKFDSGATGLLLTHDAIKSKTSLLTTNKEDTPTQNYVKLKALATLTLASLKWDSLEVYPVRLSGQGTDGRFGWDLFDDKIVSLDYDNNLMTIHQKLPNIEGYTKSKLDVVNTVLCLNGSLLVGNQGYEGRFLFDTGYQKALLLDSVILKKRSFPTDLDIIKTNRLKNGAGDVFITKVVELPGLKVGGQEINQLPTQVLNRSNPATFETHILGNELLKRFNTVFDFKNKTVYLKKNSLFDMPYSDAS